MDYLLHPEKDIDGESMTIHHMNPVTQQTMIDSEIYLVSAAGTKVVVTMEHTAKGGKHKLLENCSLPLTGKKCVDMVITEMGVFELRDNEMVLTEIDQDVSLDQVRAATGFKLKVADDLKTMTQQ